MQPETSLTSATSLVKQYELYQPHRRNGRMKCINNAHTRILLCCEEAPLHSPTTCLVHSRMSQFGRDTTRRQGRDRIARKERCSQHRTATDTECTRTDGIQKPRTATSDKGERPSYAETTVHPSVTAFVGEPQRYTYHSLSTLKTNLLSSSTQARKPPA